MNDKNNYNTDYMQLPLKLNVMLSIYETNNINFELAELFYDFIISLTSTLFNSYLGDEFMSMQNRKEHFSWVWNKTINDFSKENINFTTSSELFNYFSDFMFDSFYLNPDKSDKMNFTIFKLWKFLFNFNGVKTKSDIEEVILIYRLFEKALQN